MAEHPKFDALAADAQRKVREVSASEAAEQQRRGAMLIDVREADEFAHGHAAGAVHLSKGVLEMKIEDLAPQLDKPIVCYCGGGKRSALAVENLQRMGYTNVASLTGGMRSWKEAGLPTE